jgi:hypothetical protein
MARAGIIDGMAAEPGMVFLGFGKFCVVLDTCVLYPHLRDTLLRLVCGSRSEACTGRFGRLTSSTSYGGTWCTTASIPVPSIA